MRCRSMAARPGAGVDSRVPLCEGGQAMRSTARPAGAGSAQVCAPQPGPPARAEPRCAALPVTDPASLAQCLLCWKEAEIDELLQVLYPCLVAQVPAGSDLDCGTPPAACPT